MWHSVLSTSDWICSLFVINHLNQSRWRFLFPIIGTQHFSRNLREQNILKCSTVPFRLLKKLHFLRRNITPILFNATVSLNTSFSLFIFLEFYWETSQSCLSLMAWGSSHCIPSASSLSPSLPPASSSVSNILSLDLRRAIISAMLSWESFYPSH